MTTPNPRQIPIFFILAVILATISLMFLLIKSAPSVASPQAYASDDQAVVINNGPNNNPKIQLAILLDTSNSMDGLIDQARNQLWQAVNEFSKLKKDGRTPTLEVAVYEYGNDGLPAQNGHIRQVLNLTRDLDQVSEALYSLTTNGGNEFCGYVIHTALKDLAWSSSDSDIKAIFIAGNEPFTQGPVSYKTAIASAKKQGIFVNTIHAGSYDNGVQTGWKDGAVLAGGNFMSIDHNHQVAHIVAPQDKKIAELNAQLNQTYIPFGTKGAQGVKRQQEQDAKSNEISLGLLAKRIKSKVSSMYYNANWDLIDALESRSVDLDSLDEEQLPDELKNMSPEKKKDHIEAKAKQRKEIKAEISSLTQARDAYVAEEKRKAPKPAVSTLNEALTGAVSRQSKMKNYVVEE